MSSIKLAIIISLALASFCLSLSNGTALAISCGWTMTWSGVENCYTYDPLPDCSPGNEGASVDVCAMYVRTGYVCECAY